MATAHPRATHLPEILAVRRDQTVKQGTEETGRAASDILSVYLRGGPRYELDGVVYDLVAPAAILIPEGTRDHDLQVGSVSGAFVLFRGNGLVRRRAGGRTVVSAAPGGSPCVVPMLRSLGDAQAIRIRDLLRRIETTSPVEQAGRLLRAAYLLEAVAEYCGRRPGDPMGPHRAGVHREADRLRDIIEARAYEALPMARLYAELGVSPGRAATLFSRAFGVSPVGYRTEMRMSRARELLVSTKKNVSQVAYDVGYADALYFSRVFRRHFGITASALIRDFALSRR